MPYYERKIVSGDYVEIEQFYYSGKRIPQGETRGTTPLSQAEYNGRQSEKQFLRMIHCNFAPECGDIFATFTFAEAVDHAEATKVFRNFESRVKRRYANENAEYKRLSALEQQGKWHVHMVISGLPSLTPTEWEQLWGHGRVTVSALNKDNNYKDLSKYLYNDEKPNKADPNGGNTKPPRQRFSKRWSGTRNLKKPKIYPPKLIKRESIMRKPPTAPKGYTLIPDWVLTCDACGYLIRRYAYIRTPSKVPPKGKPPRNKTGAANVSDSDT